ncbi:MAG: phage tail terminator family protein, partial [Cetobacterium sp.]
MIYKKDIEQAIILNLKRVFPKVDVTTEEIFQNLIGEFFFIDINENSPEQLLNLHEIKRNFLINVKYWNKKENHRGIYGFVSDSLILDVFSKDLLIIPYLSSLEIEKDNPILRENEEKISCDIYSQEMNIVDNYLNFIFEISFVDSIKNNSYKYEKIDNLEGGYIFKNK